MLISKSKMDGHPLVPVHDKSTNMLISDDKRLIDIQKEFSTKFPYLKLEFYASEHGSLEGSPASAQLDLQQTVREVRSIHDEGDLSINGHVKVSTLEENFSRKYGLNVQVFRKSGSIWLQTISTDEWSLAEQNRAGV